MLTSLIKSIFHILLHMFLLTHCDILKALSQSLLIFMQVLSHAGHMQSWDVTSQYLPTWSFFPSPLLHILLNMGDIYLLPGCYKRPKHGQALFIGIEHNSGTTKDDTVCICTTLNHQQIVQVTTQALLVNGT